MRGSNRKPPPRRGFCDRPAGERARDFLDVLLRVAAVDAERVQLHQLAGVVLVDAARPRGSARPAARVAAAGRPASRSRRRRRTSGAPASTHGRPAFCAGAVVGASGAAALPVVEVEQHRRALRRRAEQIAELAEHVRPDRVALVLGEVAARRSLAGEHVEVVEPEVDHHLVELTLAVDGAQDLLLGEIGHHCPLDPRGFDLLGREFAMSRRWDGRVARGVTPDCAGARHRVRSGVDAAAARELARPPAPRLPLLALLCAAASAPGTRYCSAISRLLLVSVSSDASRAAIVRVVDLLRLELLIDIGLQADLADPLDVSRPSDRSRSG